MFTDLLERVIPIVQAAGEEVLRVYDTDFVVSGKADESPVTKADRRAEAVIIPALRTLLPGVPVVAEEAVAADDIPEVGERFWLVDPLDGTKEFIERNNEFTVNVALIERGVPVLVKFFSLAAPVTPGRCYFQLQSGASNGVLDTG